MPWQPDYCSASELKGLLRITDANDDTELAFAITSASRLVDHFCNRQFGVTTAQARIYTWDGQYVEGRQALEIDDLQSTTSLAVITLDEDGSTVHTLTNGTDFDLWPFNAAANGRPWTHLVVRPGAVSQLPCTARGVQVTGLFGWTSVPTTIKQATLLQASRIWHRRLAPFGIAGSPADGSEMRLLARIDPDVQVSLTAYRRHWGAV